MKLLEQLKNKGVALVVIRFDGAGDNGDIENIDFFDANNQAVAVAELKKDLCALAFEILDRQGVTFDDEGAFGEIVIDVENGKAELEVNTRYVDYETSSYELEVEEEDAA